ncbi:NADP-dependent aldehyde dehydrogenase [Saccharopolyspora antimicrobica]|uniref:NADP-dependent aldehyde dehydrogenase n=1 Tax=Saccharopolyspora antimicrobica TaxID=455193 RepID=A0A1I4S8A7_9PSEU|nr:NAD(P)-dependent oxidoreductase [Saccharopolyspora antimicrobica]RKT87636.1 NADP-dependent aldehyde dehydrogenase [Saccharopolyspora antimicrobica]SFM60746.1 NADP-dependent aldehyde dehydrogenase [Saccharopolyspora antimicrobica]
MPPQRILVTGAAGLVGAMLRTRLARPDRVLRLLDIQPPAAAEPGERVELRTAAITGPEAVQQACAGVDAVIHLAGRSREHTWEEILSTNVDGTRNVLEAARKAGVPRVILASSNHAVGFLPVAGAGDEGFPDEAPPRPDTYYGFSKAAMEALGSLYHSRFGMDVICLRIGACSPRPNDERDLSIWLSPDDAGRLFEACLTTPSPGFRVVWGVSRNTRRLLSPTGGEQIGYHPRDDAEDYAAEVVPNRPGTEQDYLGASFTTLPLGEPD